MKGQLIELQPKAGLCPGHKELDSQEDVKYLSSWGMTLSLGGGWFVGWGGMGVGVRV